MTTRARRSAVHPSPQDAHNGDDTKRACVKREGHSSKYRALGVRHAPVTCQGMSTVISSWVAKQCKTHASAMSMYPSTPSNAGKGSKSDVGRYLVVEACEQKCLFHLQQGGEEAYFYAPPRRRVFDELPPPAYRAGDEHMMWIVAIQFVRHDAKLLKIGREEELGVDTQRSQVDGMDRVPMRVARLHQG